MMHGQKNIKFPTIEFLRNWGKSKGFFTYVLLYSVRGSR